MYNRYIPDDTAYIPVEREKSTEQGKQTGGRPPERPFFGEGTVLHRGRQVLDALRSSLPLNHLDTGDLLLVLILLLLLTDGDEPDLALALALVFVLGLGDKKQGQP